jgi:membrane-associated phospholipid phosphatase
MPFRIVMAAASCAFVVGVSVKLIDRPVSTWVHEHLGDARFAWFAMSYDHHPLAIGPFSLMTGPSEAIWPFALVVLVILVSAAATGWWPEMRGRSALALSLSNLVAMDIVTKAQTAFGRAWPESWLGDNQSWIRDGLFGFFPFHGGPG